MNCFCENAYKDLKCELGDKCSHWVNDKTGYYLSNKLLNSEIVFDDNDIHYICSIGCMYNYTNINYNFYKNMNPRDPHDIVNNCHKFLVFRWCCQCDVNGYGTCKNVFYKCRNCSLKNKTKLDTYVSDECFKNNFI